MGIETLKAIEDDPELALVGQTDLGDDLESAMRQTEARWWISPQLLQRFQTVKPSFKHLLDR